MGGESGGAVLRVGLLGPVTASVDGVPIKLGGPRQRAVFAFLASRPRQIVAVNDIIDQVWGEEPPESANAVQVCITRLRQSLGHLGDSITSTPPGYRLDIDPEMIDAGRFASLLKAGEKEGSGRRADLADALALWAGEPLSDLGDVPFVGPERIRLQEMRFGALEERIEIDLASGGHADLIAELEMLVSDQPYREGFWRHLMLAQYRTGRQADSLATFQRLRRVLGEDLGLEPGPALVALEDAILRQDPRLDAPKQARLAEVKQPPTALIGRQHELEALTSLIRSQRLVTLLGPGGVGKTRLATEVALLADDDFPGGVTMIELADTRDPKLVIGEIARSLGVQGEDLVRDVAGLFNSSPALMVLDNVEQVVEAAEELATLLAYSKHLHLLVTSRSPLHLSGEQHFPLSPLPSVEATDLFQTRARQFQPDFDDHDAAARIANQLEGLPLALELAAATLRALPVPELIARLDDRLVTLVRGPRDLPERHRALRATLEWSTDLLSESARQLFARLSVFASPFTLANAQAVCGYGEDLVEAMFELVDASLLFVADERFRMLETIREFAHDRLVAAGNFPASEAKHAGWVHQFSLRARELLHSDKEAETILELRKILPDLRAAIDYFTSNDNHQAAAEILLSTGNLWLEDTLIVELADRLELAAKGALEPRMSGEVTAARGALAESFGDVEAGVELMRRGVETLREVGPDSVPLMNALCQLAAVAADQGDEIAAFELADEAIEVARHTGDDGSVVMALDTAGYVARLLGSLERALMAEQEAVEAGRAARTGNVAYALAGLARTLDELGRHDEAAQTALEALAAADTSASLAQRSAVLTDIGAILARSEPAMAAHRLAQAIADHIAMGHLPVAMETTAELISVIANDAPEEAAMLVGAVNARRNLLPESDLRPVLITRLRQERYDHLYRAGAQLDLDSIGRIAANAAAKLPSV